MNKTLNEMLKDQFVKVPNSIQTLILSTEFQNDLNTINIDNGVEIDKKAGLENEVVLILLGLESLTDITKNLTDNIGLTQVQAEEVVEDVLEKIVTPIEADLRSFLEKELNEEGEQEIIETKPVDKNGEKSNADEIKRMLRENSKTMNMKNFVANLK